MQFEHFWFILTNEGEAMRVFHGERHRPLVERVHLMIHIKTRVERTDSGINTKRTFSP